MAGEGTIFSLDVVKDLSDEELYQKLYESWGITDNKIDVWGELRILKSGKWAGISNARTLKGNLSIEYPLPTSQASRELQSGVYMNPVIAKDFLGNEKTVIVACQLVLAGVKERWKKNNPFLLAVDENSVERLTDLTSVLPASIVTDSESTLIRKAIYDLEIKNLKEQIESEIGDLKELLHSTKFQTGQEIEELEETRKLKQRKVSELEDALKQLTVENEQLNHDKKQISQSIAESKVALKLMEDKYRKIEEAMSKKNRKAHQLY